MELILVLVNLKFSSTLGRIQPTTLNAVGRLIPVPYGSESGAGPHSAYQWHQAHPRANIPDEQSKETPLIMIMMMMRRINKTDFSFLTTKRNNILYYISDNKSQVAQRRRVRLRFRVRPISKLVLVSEVWELPRDSCFSGTHSTWNSLRQYMADKLQILSFHYYIRQVSQLTRAKI